ncbi:MAG: hypothetical protein ACK47B_27000 [Armatimonadota bacterium]
MRPEALRLQLPEGATAQVERLEKGIRVTLRPQGRERWAVVAFLSLWMMGWAAGELSALDRILPWITGWITSSPSAGDDGPPWFMLFWTTFWTFGGVVAASMVLRLGFGRDTIEISPDGWILRQGVGPLVRRSDISAADVERVELLEDDSKESVSCQVGAESVQLTSYGTATDRRWLCDLLRRAAGLTSESETATDPASMQDELVSSTPYRTARAGKRIDPLREGAVELPPGWQAAHSPEGEWVLSRTAGHYLASAAGLLFINLFWNGIVGVFVAVGAGSTGGSYEGPGLMRPGAIGYWLFLTPFVAIGLAMFAGLVWTVFGREEWRLRRNRVEHRKWLPGWSRTREYRDGRVALSRGSSESYTLRIEAGEDQAQVHIATDPAPVRVLGAYFARHTGWPLEESED